MQNSEYSIYKLCAAQYEKQLKNQNSTLYTHTQYAIIHTHTHTHTHTYKMCDFIVRNILNFAIHSSPCKIHRHIEI